MPVEKESFPSTTALRYVTSGQLFKHLCRLDLHCFQFSNHFLSSKQLQHSLHTMKTALILCMVFLLAAAAVSVQAGDEANCKKQSKWRVSRRSFRGELRESSPDAYSQSNGSQTHRHFVQGTPYVEIKLLRRSDLLQGGRLVSRNVLLCLKDQRRRT